MTWDDLRITCLQKIFEIKGDTLTQDSNTQQYIKSMPAAANEAMLILATAGRYIRKCTTLDFGSTDAPKADFSMGAGAFDNLHCQRHARGGDGQGPAIGCGYSRQFARLFAIKTICGKMPLPEQANGGKGLFMAHFRACQNICPFKGQKRCLKGS